MLPKVVGVELGAAVVKEWSYLVQFLMLRCCVTGFHFDSVALASRVCRLALVIEKPGPSRRLLEETPLERRYLRWVVARELSLMRWYCSSSADTLAVP